MTEKKGPCLVMAGIREGEGDLEARQRIRAIIRRERRSRKGRARRRFAALVPTEGSVEAYRGSLRAIISQNYWVLRQRGQIELPLGPEFDLASLGLIVLALESCRSYRRDWHGWFEAANQGGESSRLVIRPARALLVA